jgi:hypothetical protein
MMQKAPKIRNFKVSTLASALPLSSFDKPNATTAPHAEAARTRAWLGGQIQSCWVFVCRWLPHDAGALTIPVYCPSKAWQMRVDDAIGFHRSQSLKVLQNITQDQWLTVLMSLLTSRSCGQVAFHSVGPLFKAALDSPKHKSHQDKRVLTRIGNRKI